MQLIKKVCILLRRNIFFVIVVTIGLIFGLILQDVKATALIIGSVYVIKKVLHTPVKLLAMNKMEEVIIYIVLILIVLFFCFSLFCVFEKTLKELNVF